MAGHAARSHTLIRRRLLIPPVVLLLAFSIQPVSPTRAAAAPQRLASAPGSPATGSGAGLLKYPAGPLAGYTARTAAEVVEEPVCDEATLPAPVSIVAQPRETAHLRHDAVDLEVGPDVVSNSTTMEARSLCQPSMALLDQGMTNVTKGPRRGYRLLPNGKYRAHMRISVPYDPLLIPGGQTDQDVYTFYYDEQTTSWRALERVAVDGANSAVISLTDHFTDFINAVVTVPDHPETFSHNPNSLKDIKAADPGAGVNVVNPPRLNSNGDARLSYPIELPPGRNGRAPELGLTYNSGGGNGWLGIGWDLATPAITVETRWGVPRYATATETETYTLNGDQLAPVAHRGPAIARTADKVFHTRVEGAFRKIVRHGSSPATYWWEVTDKDGTRSFYGGDPQTGAQAADSVLTDDAGNAYRWALRETRDLNGNGIRYTHATVADVGVAGGTVQGRQLYPRMINYTLSGSTPGGYTIMFVRDSELPGYVRRPDAVITARGGFKMVTAELLGRIDIALNGALVRRYDLAYSEGAFRKTLLRSVTQRGGSGAVFHRHEFSYYDDLRDAGGAYNGFDAATNWATGNDGVTAGLLDHGQASALSGSLNTSVGGHLYVGFNPLRRSKQGSFGGKVGFNHGSSDGVLAMVDLNGDNLPDKVFRLGGGVHFRLNTSGPDGSADFAGSRSAVPSLPGISAESSDLSSFGAESYVVANVFVNEATTFTTTSTYFADANGDGLMDLVDNGRVLFNHLDANGVPTFTANSADTPVPIGAGAVDTTAIVDDFAALFEQQIDAYPLADTLRRWEAPFSGRVRITGTVALIEDTSPARAEYQTADGVRVAIQHESAELWSEFINGTDYGAKTPQNVDSIVVGKGDHLYFRVQSRFDGAFDRVAWNPEISYLDVTPVTDVNNLDAYRYRAAEDFVLAGRRGVGMVMPLNGSVRLTGDLRKRTVTTDDITLLVLRNGVAVFGQTVAWDEIADVPLSLDIPVSRDDTVALRVQVDSPIDVRALEWTPRLFYTASPDTSPIVDGSGNPLIRLDPPYDVDLYPVGELAAPQQPWVVPASGTVTVSPQISGTGAANGTVTFTVKRRGLLVAKRAIAVTNGVGANADLPLDVTAGQELFFDFSVADPVLAGQLTSASVTVDDGSGAVGVPSARHSAAAAGLMAAPYRGWAYVGYNGNRDRALQPIVEADLAQAFTEASTYDPRTAKAYLFNPFPAEASWRGPDDLGWVMAASMSSSRLGLDALDVPLASDFAGGRAVDRLSHAAQTAIGGGISFFSGSTSNGTTAGRVDYLDLNGDKFPDIVSAGRIQYTTATGALEDANRQVPGLGGPPRDGTASAVNVGIGGSPAEFAPNGRGKVDADGQSPPRSDESGTQMVPLGLALAAGLGSGDSDPRHDLIDVNGDGLPDRVTASGSTLLVALNLGYGFAPAESWGSVAINDGASENGSIGASIGFNDGIYGFGGGGALTKHKSQTSATLLDINADGLLDRVLPSGTGGVRVGFNTGNGFTAPVSWAGAMSGVCRDDTSLGLAGIDWDQTRLCSGNTGLGGGLYFTIGIGPLCGLGCFIIINPGADASQNMSREESLLRDVDGDGYADHLASTDDGSMRVARNRTGRTNLLRSVVRPLGATITVEYQRDGNTVEQPDSRWVLSKTTVFDGHAGDGVDTLVTTYAYENGFYNRLEREFYGYRKVTESQRDAANGEALYRSVVSEFRNDSFYTKGLPARVRTVDAAGRPFSEVESTYLLRDVASGAAPADPNSTTASIFPQLVRTDERHYEGNATPGKTTFGTQQFDQFGNVVTFTDAGENGAQDDVTSTIDHSDCPESYVVGVPTSIRVTGNGAELRRREATVDCTTGNVTQVREFLADGTAAVTDMDYFPDGNLQRLTEPANQAGQRYQLSYEYDPVLSTHVVRVADSHGIASTATYDLRYGAVATNTDANNNRTSHVYDDVGRVTSITGPSEQGGTTPTIRFEYHPEAAVPWARTRHLDPFRSGTDTIDTGVFIDGLRRPVQTKKDITVHTGPNSAPQDVMVVSGRITFDHVGRAAQTRYPLTEPLGTPGAFNTTVDGVAPTRMTYDVLDRVTSLALPDNTTTTTAYGFGADRSGATQLQATVTDANGNLKRTSRNVRGLITSVQEFHNGQPIWTSFAYDPLDQVVEVRDDHNNRTTTAYDNLGRRTVLETPDAGRTETRYDLASNTVAQVTANLRAEGKQIGYAYDFHRLVGVSYPNFPGNNVTYTYGAPGASDNRAGRVTRVTDESGVEERFYGRLGEITTEISSIASDTGPSPEVYTTQYRYDTFGRLQSLLYPDGELLTYQYDAGGMIRAASGQKGAHSYAYVNRLEYDKFGDRAFMEAGNNVRTSYSYDPLNRRLAGLQAGKTDGQRFQNLSYGYDDVGNVLSLTNAVPIPPPSQDGGPTAQTYSYDDLYRLTGANGAYQFAPDKTDRYSYSLSYDSIHNILGKQQTHEIIVPPGVPVTQHKTTYNHAYTYGAQPHAPTHIGVQTFTYDANGNQTGWTDDQSGQRRTIVWDEANRMQSLFDNGHEKTYKYDDAGERVIKRGPQGETVYVNQYFTIRNKNIGTKHVFAGTTRSVSKLMKQNAQTREKDLFFFHADHLGSSNYVSDANGEVYQHTEYFPSGETWVDESSNKQRTPYLFSGKELDEETGLYYYGARYYDPRTGAWESHDPALESYLPSAASPGGDLPGMGGVYNSFNLNAYAYAHTNPIRHVDPDGRDATLFRGEDGREMIAIRPRDTTAPSVNIPNTIGATGFRIGPWWDFRGEQFWSHTYNVRTRHEDIPFDRAREIIGNVLGANPTPAWRDRPASPEGAENNALAVIPGIGLEWLGHVRSFRVPSPDPSRFTDVVVNYTDPQYILHEGIVVRFGERSPTGGTILRSYGEGVGPAQGPYLLWRIPNVIVWQQNQELIAIEVRRRLQELDRLERRPPAEGQRRE